MASVNRKIASWTINTNIHFWFNVITTTNRASNSLAVYEPTFCKTYNLASTTLWLGGQRREIRLQTDIKYAN